MKSDISVTKTMVFEKVRKTNKLIAQISNFPQPFKTALIEQ